MIPHLISCDKINFKLYPAFHSLLGREKNMTVLDVWLLSVTSGHFCVIYTFITQPTLYRVIAYFSLFHELASDRSIVLDITWDYTMAWYPAQKIIYNGLVPTSIDIRAIAMFHMFTS